MQMYVNFQLLEVMPKASGCSSSTHLTSGVFLQLFHLSFRGSLPWSIRLSLSYMEMNINKFIVELAYCIHSLAIHHHR